MKISVYITSYNQKQYLVEAIESVLAQTLPASQIIIVDDCSQDGSQEVIAGYRARYPALIAPIYHAQNRGVAWARADALQMVTGDYVTYVDGDDRYLPTKLEKEAALLQRRCDADIAFSNSYYMKSDGQYKGQWITNRKPPEGYIFRETFGRVFPRGRLFRMELVPYKAWKEIGFHDVNLRLLEDWDMRIRLSKRLRVAYCDEPLSEIRRHHQGLSSLGAAERLKALDYIWQKNRLLLQDLDSADEKYIAGRIRQLRAEFVRRQAKEQLGAYGIQPGSKKRALAFYRESWRQRRYVDLDLILGLVLPSALYGWLRGAASYARRVRDERGLSTDVGKSNDRIQ
jgi:glycosyltransferase involved in cell wall biosynthesis